MQQTLKMKTQEKPIKINDKVAKSVVPNMSSKNFHKSSLIRATITKQQGKQSIQIPIKLKATQDGQQEIQILKPRASTGPKQHQREQKMTNNRTSTQPTKVAKHLLWMPQIKECKWVKTDTLLAQGYYEEATQIWDVNIVACKKSHIRKL